jgi:hypothetical protein
MASNLWASGWRPFYGWVGSIGFLYTVLLQPLLAWYALIRGWPTPPVISTDTLMVVITGVLGIGGLRTYEKQKGVTK